MSALPAPTPLVELRDYTTQLSTRIHALEKEGSSIILEEQRREERLAARHAELKSQIQALQQEMGTLQRTLATCTLQSHRLVYALKGAVRRPEFDRLARRVEAWKGEQFITRDEWQKLRQ